MADFEFDCPKCGGHLSVAERSSGMFVPCPECGQTIQVPQIGKTTSETLTFTCSYCGKTLSCSSDKLGEVIECPMCHQLPLVSEINLDVLPQKSKKKVFPFRNWVSNKQSHKRISKPSSKEYEMTKRQGAVIITLLLIALGFPFFSYLKPAQTWEYKHITMRALPFVQRTGPDAFDYSSIEFHDSSLDSLGGRGWELVGSYLEMETAFPNFGKSDFVTGIQPNIRPQCLVLIFKRPVNHFSDFMDGYYRTSRDH